MSPPQSTRTINKAYPPQVSVSKGKLNVYSPIEQWVEVHTSKSLEDVIEIETVSQPLFMNASNNEITFQSEHTLWVSEIQHEILQTYKRRFWSEQSIVTDTQIIGDYYVNLTCEGSINLWPVLKGDSVRYGEEQSNPESMEEISDKIQEEAKSGKNAKIETCINVETLAKQYKNGYSFGNIVPEGNSFLTLHKFGYQNGQKRTRICNSQLTNSQCCSSYFKSFMPQKICCLSSVSNNSIMAYGDDQLLLIDRRSQSIVSRLNDLEDSHINFTKKSTENEHYMYVCRDSYLLLQDTRKQAQIAEVVLDFGQEIEYFDVIRQQNSKVYCVSSKFKGSVSLFEKVR